MTGTEAIQSAIGFLRADQSRDRDDLENIVFEPEVILCEQRMDGRQETIDRLHILEGETAVHEVIRREDSR